MCKSVQVCHRYLLDRPHFSGLDTIQSLYKISFGKFKKDNTITLNYLCRAVDFLTFKSSKCIWKVNGLLKEFHLKIIKSDDKTPLWKKTRA